MGDAYAEALWAAHPAMNEAADFVMYWWDHAALLLAAKKPTLRRFGFVTTNSITQVFQRRTVARYLEAKAPISLLMAIPDHPWTKATDDAAAVRIAMTVAQAGKMDGLLQEVIKESDLNTDTPHVEFATKMGAINSDLTIGANLSGAGNLKSNTGLCSRGVVLHGAGFIVLPKQAIALGLSRRANLDKHIRHYRNGRDITNRPRGVMVIDLFGLTRDEVREQFPEVYQYVVLHVKENKNEEGILVGRDVNKRGYRKENWWLFGENVPELRSAIKNINRYVVTVETSKHRIFTFLDGSIVPDNMLVTVATDDPFVLGVLSSSIHSLWAIQAGGWLGVGNDPRYSKSRCFDPFPFPAADDLQKARIRRIAEDLDAHRKRVLADHPHLTLTGLYNVLEKLRAGTAPEALPPADQAIFRDGLVLILKELHDKLDVAVAAAYGWPVDLPEQEILTRLVALNRERAAEEATGHIRWLRPEYQIPRFGSASDKLDLRGGKAAAAPDAAPATKPAFPTDEVAQAAAILSALFAANAPLTPDALAATFRGGRRNLPRIEATLAALTRLGHLSTPDGRTFALRRAA